MLMLDCTDWMLFIWLETAETVVVLGSEMEYVRVSTVCGAAPKVAFRMTTFPARTPGLFVCRGGFQNQVLQRRVSRTGVVCISSAPRTARAMPALSRVTT